jgi:hypothetical protein
MIMKKSMEMVKDMVKAMVMIFTDWNMVGVIFLTLVMVMFIVMDNVKVNFMVIFTVVFMVIYWSWSFSS